MKVYIVNINHKAAATFFNNKNVFATSITLPRAAPGTHQDRRVRQVMINQLPQMLLVLKPIDAISNKFMSKF